MSATDVRWQRVNRLFHAAIARTPGERDGFLAAQCGTDAALRVEVQSLLAAHQGAGTSGGASLVAAGTRLGDYEVTSFLAAGGMGEVYRARDIKLGRDVALKILPQVFVEDPDRRARFDREARLLASLNHPNIATIYGFVDDGGVSALALELVEGETLAERIARGKLPVDEALRVARQMAEALEAAHEQGIIHRDLKPANIKLTRDGTVKVLDFGLAKLTQPSDLAGVLTPTLTSAGVVTGAHVLLGTPAYMSPEQARGEPVDKRTDIWALGCVVYEMLTGTPPFEGSTLTEVLARVLEREPDLRAVPALTPSNIRTLLRRCLEKDPRRRLDSAAVARLEIDDVSRSSTGDIPTAPSGAATQVRRLTFGVAVIAITATTSLAAWMVMHRTSPLKPPVARFEIVLPAERSLWAGDGANVVISPDGTRVAYVGSASISGETQLIVRSMDELAGLPVHGTEGARSPFFSPDGRWVAFFAGTEIRKVPVAGGPSVTVCRIVPLNENRDASGSWGDDDTIFFSRDMDDSEGGLQAVPARGGEPRTVISTIAANLERGFGFPAAVPRRRALLVTVKHHDNRVTVDVLDLDSNRRKTLLRDGREAHHVGSSSLVYIASSARTLQAVRFDVDRLEIVGDPVTLLGGIAVAGFNIATTGALAYVPGGIVGSNAGARTLVWVDRNGDEVLTGAPARSYGSLRLSPDGQRAAVDIRTPTNSAWVWDFARHSLTRLSAGQEIAGNPVWTRDGRLVAVNSIRGNSAVVITERADGTGMAERLSDGPYSGVPKAATPDGKTILTGANADLGLVSLEPPFRAQVFLEEPGGQNNPDVSPDGRWLAYESDESGQIEVYVRPFPDVNAGRWQVSTAGGRQPLWARNREELFFLDNDGFLTAVAIRTGPTFNAGPATRVLNTRYPSPGANRVYDVSPDGRRFLMMKDVAAAESGDRPANVVVVLNWLEELKRFVPTN